MVCFALSVIWEADLGGTSFSPVFLQLSGIFFLSPLSLWDIRRLLCNYFEMHKIEEKLTSSPASYKLIVLLPDQVLHLFEKKHEAGY